MSELVVLTFNSEAAALAARDRFIRLQRNQAIALEDAAVVVRRADGGAKVHQITNLSRAGALGGAFWGGLIGFLLAVPWAGAAIGAVTGALAGKFSDMGVDDQFIKEVGDRLEPGEAALFLYLDKVPIARLQAELAYDEVGLLQTSLSPEQEAKLAAMLNITAVGDPPPA